MSAKSPRTAIRWFAIVLCAVSLPLFFGHNLWAEEGIGGCEIVNFDAFEESQAVLTPAGEYKVTSRRQCANLSIRNTSGSARAVEDFLVIAVFGNGSIDEGGLDLSRGDAKRLIGPGDTYNGTTCLDSGSPIIVMNCAVK